ncbi:Rha family transcriptional regulator [Candidatus Sodalis sp. SoCistrobi]|uniref:Rha family transcriptional regulator n=1 Tax=Candidatus Sodalis sp. SoCistrobi TaxID=1922216 RepID=UPI0009399299|nr:Rha family transcriptional regulator [Candidatus Sodalis sp. SoCistrobi]
MQNLVSEHILTMSSREIAELTEKHHHHVLRDDIESMIVDLGEDPEEYVHFWAPPQDGQQYREYLLDRDHTECLLIEYSVVHRMRVIKSWHEFEERASQFPYHKRILKLYASLPNGQKEHSTQIDLHRKRNRA